MSEQSPRGTQSGSPGAGPDASAPSVRVLGAGDRVDLDRVRQFIRDYAAWLCLDLGFQHFDEELATLHCRYEPTQGRLFYAASDGRGVG